MNPVKAYFFPTVDSVLGQFHKSINNLRKVSETHFAQAQLREDEAAKLVNQAVQARREAARADQVISKLEGLIK